MAYENSSAVLPVPAAHPLAKPGYGKRSAPDQAPPRKADFRHLPAREAYLAALIDRLADNAAMDAKTLAKAQPLYGQQAVRSALNALGRAGHLRRVRRCVVPGDGTDTGTRWVSLTYWSRTARHDAWWARFLDGDVNSGEAVPPKDTTPARDTTPAPDAAAGAGPSAAHTALARLGLHEPRLSLSAADCAALEPLAADWLARGVSPAHLIRVLAADLPEAVYSPSGFVRRRLIDRLPPEIHKPAEPAADGEASGPPPIARRTLPECTNCGVPGRPEALPGGLCRTCRNDCAEPESPTPTKSQPPRPLTVRELAAQVRQALRPPQRA